MNKIISQKTITYFIFFFVIFLFFMGFYFNENSAGAGGYNGDISWILQNIEIFKYNELQNAIFHKDLFGNRPPLIYILNKLFNPFFYEYEKYRIFVFVLSLLGPIFIYLNLKKNHPNTNNELLLLLSSIILLSPYYRTSAYWALNENYGLISAILSLICLNFFLKKIEIEKKINKYFYLTIFFSSLSVYFDQKYLIVTMICFFSVVFSKINIKIKLYAFLTYSFFSIPYLILIYKWGGIVPVKTQILNPNTITSLSRLNQIHLYHLGYASTIISFYLFPLLMLKQSSISKTIRRFFSSKWAYVIILVPLIYIFLISVYYDFNTYTVDDYWIGLGVVHKSSLILFSNLKYQEIFTYITFFFSWIIICLYFEKKITDWLIIIFFFLFSILIWPLMQEYFDPVLIILGLMAFKTKIKLNYYSIFFIFLYFFSFLVIANVYYLKVL
ncbi:hypothetical protein N8726_03135 [Pelagibacteraceae bacterium]|nr:hypothetical protein [Pelagibacteraceae bacterium]